VIDVFHDRKAPFLPPGDIVTGTAARSDHARVPERVNIYRFTHRLSAQLTRDHGDGAHNVASAGPDRVKS
jgi:hypothetical protein